MAKTENKIDLFKEYKSEYKATAKPGFVQTGPAQYLMIDGQGAPGGSEFEERIGALYSMAFTIKMTRKFAGLGDYTVCKLEGLWFTEDGTDDFANLPQEQWQWTLMIRTPECVKKADLEKAAKALLDKGKAEAVKDVRLEKLKEGKCVQVLHVGPYDQVCEAIEKMQAFAKENGKTFTGKHHEIYLSDPRRVAPEKLKTIVRRPVA
ncbi:MAG: GyrI-like domain-containing protein [Phycisphaerae bacterium]|nr:GyrI-like domain-containing protein [Phycisphaerae bacterium]